ncbi:MAG: hypothetical protein K2Q10_00655 [Rhodospirillales bacterium]|nr:hypothetical protein [Rhodospirillales bacterium]
MSGGIILYNTEDGRTQLRLEVVDGTIWLSQAEMAELFQTTKQNVSVHIRNILAEGELASEATVKEYLTVQTEGERQVQRSVSHDRMLKIIDQRYATFDAARTEADRQTTEMEHEQEVEDELKRIEAATAQAKRVVLSSKKKTRQRKGDGE